mmetsp:Transcript_2459/g.5198  ORF Transcript_2459/g.5198 Transcript_2459/m.5198 type:complete len:300 (-) Transcript_2459:87-986(-)
MCIVYCVFFWLLNRINHSLDSRNRLVRFLCWSMPPFSFAIRCLSNLVITFRVGSRLGVHVGPVLADNSVTVELEGAKVVRASSRLALPVGARGSLLFDFAGNRLGQKVVLVLAAVITHLADDGLIDQIFPSALFGKIDGVFGVLKVEGGIASVGIGGGIPVHEGILPSLSDGTVIVKGNLPVFFWIQGILVGTGPQLLDDDHALSSIGHAHAGLVTGIEGANLGLVFRKNRGGKIFSRIKNHHLVLFHHGFHLFCEGGNIFGFVRLSGLDQSLFHRNDASGLGALNCFGNEKTSRTNEG